MIGRHENNDCFDPILTSKILLIPDKKELNELTCEFKLPVIDEDINIFMSSEDGKQYLFGVNNIIDKIISLSLSRHINISGYQLGLISEADRKFYKIYIEVTDIGLKYELIGLDNTLKNATVLWNQLPHDFPRNIESIVEMKEILLLILVEKIAKFNDGYRVPLLYFRNKINHQCDAKDFFPYTEVSFQLFTDGIKMLNKITQLMEDTRLSENKKEMALIEIGSGLGVCSPGCYTVIQNVFISLINNPDIQMLTIRTNMAQQIAQSLIEEYNSRSDIDDVDKIHGGNITHYVAAILNYHRNIFGLEFNDDKFVPKDINAVMYFSKEFVARMYSQLHCTHILDAILENLQLNELISNIQKSPDRSSEYSDEFCERLANYGTDKLFSITSLFDQDKLENNEYELSPVGVDYLVLTLLTRLKSSGYIQYDAYSVEYQLDDNVKLIYLPLYPIHFSYVISQYGECLPLSVYALDEAKKSNHFIVNIINTVQKNDLYKKMWNYLLSSNGVTALVPISTSSDEERVLYACELHKDLRNVKLIHLLSLMPDTIVNEFLKCLNQSYLTSNISYSKYEDNLSTLVKISSVSLDYLRLLQSHIETESDFNCLLNSLEINKRYSIFSLFNEAKLKKFTQSISLPEFLLKFNDENRFHVLSILNVVDNKIEKINSTTSFANLLTSLSPKHYQDLIHLHMGMKRISEIMPSTEEFMVVLLSIPEDCRSHFIQIIGPTFIFSIINNDVSMLGYVLSPLSVCDMLFVLNNWYENNLQALFNSAEVLIGFLHYITPDIGANIIKALPIVLLQSMIKSPEQLGLLLSAPHSFGMVELIQYIGVDYCKQMLNNESLFKRCFMQLQPNVQVIFTKNFSTLLSDSDLDLYNSGDKTIYYNLVRFKAETSLTQSNALLADRFFTRRNLSPISQPLENQHLSRQLDGSRLWKFGGR